MNRAKILFLFSIILFPAIVSGQTFLEKMEDDLQKERISRKDFNLNMAYAMFAPERLPDEYKFLEERNIKCGTTFFIELNANLDKLTMEEQQFLVEQTNRPSPQILPSSYTTPEGNFKIHYTTLAPPVGLRSDQVPLDDLNNNSIPDFVEEAGWAFEHSYRFHVDTLGYRPMPSDGDEYDVFMRDLQGMYGVTFEEFDIPETNWYDKTSYIIIDNDYQNPTLYTKGVEGMRVTAAHELHHAIQMGYVIRTADLWLYEWTSTWAEDMAFKNINDYYQYLSNTQAALFSNFHRPMTTFNGWHEYGMCIWAHFLTKEYGNDILRNIWEQLHLHPAMQTMEIVIEEETPMTFENVIHQFFTWNYYTGDRADTVRYYTDGKNFPEVSYDEDLYQENDTTLTFNSFYLTGTYTRITRQQPTVFAVTAEGRETEPDVWRVGLLASDDLSTPGNPNTNQITFLNGYSGSGDVTAAGINPELIIVSSNTAQHMSEDAGGRYLLTLDLSFSGPPPIVSNKLLPTRPSPANFSRISNAVIPFVLTENSEINMKIYSLTGRLIKSFPPQYFGSGLHTSLFWNGRDNNGGAVSSGIYLCVLKGQGFTVTKKIAVVR